MPTRAHDELRGPPAWMLAAALALLWLALAPRTPDLAAQVYRTSLWAREGFEVWNPFWFAGHHLPAYGLLYPPLGALLGARTVGVVFAVASTVLFARLARNHVGATRARWATLWFAVASVADLCIGRLTFSLGITLGLGALLALQSGRPRVAVALAALCGFGSPVAAAFLGLAGAAVALTDRTRRTAATWLAVTALGCVAALAFAFPEGGRQPMSTVALLAVLGGCAVLLAALEGRERTLRLGVVLYAGSSVAMFALHTPMGSNVARLGATFAGPLLVLAVAHRPRPALPGPRRVLAVAVVALAAWQWWGPTREIVVGAGDPSTQAAYFTPLKDFLTGRGGPPGRVEVPFTRAHWEAVHLAGGAQPVALARGWETQLDRRYNALFFTPGALTPQAYERWLRRNAVRHVALPDVPLDPSGKAEARLVAAGLPFLTPVWRNANWRVWEVRDATALAAGPARLERFDRRGFALDAPGPGTTVVRTHFSRWFTTTGAPACLSATPDGFTRVRALGAGRIAIGASITSARVGGGVAGCRPRAVTLR